MFFFVGGDSYLWFNAIGCSVQGMDKGPFDLESLRAIPLWELFTLRVPTVSKWI